VFGVQGVGFIVLGFGCLLPMWGFDVGAFDFERGSLQIKSDNFVSANLARHFQVGSDTSVNSGRP